MKAVFLILALLVHTVHSDPHDKAETIKLFNSARSLIAQKDQIANMNQLDYWTMLEDMIHRQLREAGECPDPRRTYIDYEVPIEIHLNVKLEKMDGQSILKLAGGAEKYGMAYVVTKCMATGADVHNFAFAKWHTPEVHGPPASNCGYLYALPDGLCGRSNGGPEIH